MSQVIGPIGINGFGRMGFCALRICIEENLPVVAINASRTPAEIARLLRFDSVHGRYNGKISYDDEHVIIDSHKILVTNERDPSAIPWKKSGAEYIIECTGKFLTKDIASSHLTAGAKKVIISAPSKDQETPMFVVGVNETLYESSMDVVSNASCTTNCLAPLAKVIHDNFGIESGLMTTVHALTSKQNTVDGYNAKDERIARSCFNIIPSSTGAAKAVGRIIPELSGKLTGMALRVPIADVSVVDLSVNFKTPTSYEDICEAIKKAAFGQMSNVLQYWDDPVVSSDFINDPVACNFDATAGIMLSPTFAKLIAWYDNEWAYMHQLIRLIHHMYLVDNH